MSIASALTLQGQQLYRTNETMQNMFNVLNHPEFALFFKKYFCDLTKAKCTLMLLELHNEIEETYPDYNPYEVLATMYEWINNTKVRQRLVYKWLPLGSEVKDNYFITTQIDQTLPHGQNMEYCDH
jgi:hypothetical protein